MFSCLEWRVGPPNGPPRYSLASFYKWCFSVCHLETTDRPTTGTSKFPAGSPPVSSHAQRLRVFPVDRRRTNPMSPFPSSARLARGPLRSRPWPVLFITGPQRHHSKMKDSSQVVRYKNREEGNAQTWTTQKNGTEGGSQAGHGHCRYGGNLERGMDGNESASRRQ